MAISQWISFLTHVTEAEAYRRATYLPAGSWLEVDWLDELEGESAAFLYGEACTKALLLQGHYKNLDRTWCSKVFLVPSESPTLPSTEYRADWSEEHQLFIVKPRSKAKKAHIGKDLAFAHFNWTYLPVDNHGNHKESSATSTLFEQEDSQTNHSIMNLSHTVGESKPDLVGDTELSREPSTSINTVKSWADINGEDLANSEDTIETVSGRTGISKNDEHDSLLNVFQSSEISIPSLDTEHQPQVERLEVPPRQHLTFEAFENSFWEEIWDAKQGCANPIGLPHDNRFQIPAGQYRALSIDCRPQDFVSSTTPAISLWAVTSQHVWHWQHGLKNRNYHETDCSPFSRKSILCAQACKTLTPVVYHGPGPLLYSHGSQLHNAVTGYALKSFLPLGSIKQETPDLDDPCMLHNPSDPHWSSLTMPASYTTPPYYYDETTEDHNPTVLPYGRPRHTVARGESRLRDMTLCYLGEEEEFTEAAHSAPERHEVEAKNIAAGDEDEGRDTPSTESPQSESSPPTSAASPAFPPSLSPQSPSSPTTPPAPMPPILPIPPVHPLTTDSIATITFTSDPLSQEESERLAAALDADTAYFYGDDNNAKDKPSCNDNDNDMDATLPVAKTGNTQIERQLAGNDTSRRAPEPKDEGKEEQSPQKGSAISGSQAELTEKEERAVELDSASRSQDGPGVGSLLASDWSWGYYVAAGALLGVGLLAACRRFRR